MRVSVTTALTPSSDANAHLEFELRSVAIANTVSQAILLVC